MSPFVLQFYRNNGALKPIALSVLCRVQVHWLRQNPKFKALSIDIRPLVTSTFLTHHCVCSLIKCDDQWGEKGTQPVGCSFAIERKFTEEHCTTKKHFDHFISGGITGGKLFNINFKLSLSSTLNKSFNFCTPVLSL